MRQLLYFSSSNRASGTPSDFTVVLGNAVFTSKPGMTTRVLVSEASVPRTWFSFPQGRNTFTILPTNYPVTLPIGYLNAIDIRNQLQTSLPAGWSVTYSRLTNKFSFSRPLDTVETYIFDMSSFPAESLGFQGPRAFFYNNTEVSQKPIRVSNESALLLHTDLQKSACSFDNLGNQSFADSTILAKIPVSSAPFDNITFVHEGELNFQEVTATHVDSLRVWLTDDFGNAIDLPHDWSFTLIVDYVPRAPDQTVEEIRDLVKLMALSDNNILQQ